MNKLIVILGPTATGKSDLGVKLAKKFQGEIVSADSRQVYKGMIIGTASPCQKNQNAKCKMQNDKEKFKIKELQKPILIDRIPHYLLHIISPNQRFNVAIYKKLAIKIIRDIQKRGKVPILCGGTGLYLRAITENMFFLNIPAQLCLRKKLEYKTNEELLEIYQNLDSEGAILIDSKNKRRLIRAIEVCQVSGNPFWAQRKKGKPLFDFLKIGLKLSANEIEKRIRKRVNQMIQLGLEKEVKSLVKKYGWNIPALQTIGYQEWRDYWNGNIKKNELKDLIVLRTKQFAKRQMTWFKRDLDVYWIDNYQDIKKKVRMFLE